MSTTDGPVEQARPGWATDAVPASPGALPHPGPPATAADPGPGRTGSIVLRSLLALAIASATGVVGGVVVAVLYALTADPSDGWADLIAVLMGILAAGLVMVLAFWGLMVPVVRRFAPPGRRLAVLWVSFPFVVGVPVLAAAAAFALPLTQGGGDNMSVLLAVLVASVVTPPAVLAVREGRRPSDRQAAHQV